jgi:DNA-binding NtrC family response regulator
VARLEELIRRAAPRPGPVIVTAPAGADVESVARELHARSAHVAGPFVTVDCDARDALDIERQLFGLAPPDAGDLESVARDSRIAAALGGTLFLRDVTDLPAGAQARLARLTRDGEMRLDGRPAAAALRLVASAAPAIEAEVTALRFRADLYRRLSTSRVDMPALSERAEDIPLLATRLVEELSAPIGPKPRAFTKAALALLGALTWPGNLSELRQVIERVLAHTTNDVLQIEHVLPALQLDRAPTPFVPSGNLREARLQFEREYIAAVLQHHRWRMADAAQTLGIQRPNLYRKARQLGIPLARVTE